MRFLKSLLDPAFRGARRAEGRQDYRRAAALYLEADAPEEAVRALLFHAAVTEDRTERIQAYRQALQWLDPESARYRQVEERFALLLLEEAQAVPLLTGRERGWLREAGERLAGMGRHSDAARAFRLLEDDPAALENLARAGDLEQLEAALTSAHQERKDDRRRKRALADYEAARKTGARREALAALEGAIVQGNPGVLEDVTMRLEGFRKAIPSLFAVRCSFSGQQWLLCGRFPLVVGRGDADLNLRDPAISRRHLQLEPATLLDGRPGIGIEDLGSRYGIRVNGVRFSEKSSHISPVECQISDTTVIVLALEDGGQLGAKITRGPDQGLRVFASGAFPMRPPGTPFVLDFPEGWPRLWHGEGHPLILNGQRCVAPIELLRGDRFVVEGARHQAGEVLD